MKKSNILVFGDSITYGETDLELGGWLNRLRLYLDSKIECYIFNLGISGETTSEILNRFDAECKARHGKFGYKTRIFFAIGLNDTRDNDGKDKIFISQFEANIKELIKKGNKCTQDLLFIGLTHVDESKIQNTGIYRGYSNDKIIKFDNIIERICCEQKVSYIKMFDLLDKNDLADGLHLIVKDTKRCFSTF